jgi:hypothetical protein
LQNKRLSSAKKKWHSIGPLEEVGTPVIIPFCSAFDRRELKFSAQIRKKIR